MLFRKGSELICFTHIPRNGGRFVYELLKKNSFVMDPVSVKFQRRKFYREQEYLHLTYDRIAEIHPNVIRAKKIVIVRNPVDKFKSAVGTEWAQNIYLGGTSSNMLFRMEDPKYFEHVMERKHFALKTRGVIFKFDGLKNTFTNWFRPQSEFFNEDFYVWKFEDGLDLDFRVFLRDRVGLDIDINIEIGRDYEKPLYDNKIEGFSLSKKLSENVSNFYWSDYQIWKQL